MMDTAECIEWPYLRRDHPTHDYGILTFRKVMWRAHRLVMLLTEGPCPEGMEVCHSCDNPGCVNPAHLRYDTHAANMRDMKDRGRQAAPHSQAQAS